MRRQKVSETDNTERVRPALTPEASDMQLYSMARTLLFQRLENGTATSQEIALIMKEHSRSAELEKQLLEQRVELAKAKTQQIESEQRVEEMYSKAIAAMKLYGGHDDEEYTREDVYIAE